MLKDLLDCYHIKSFFKRITYTMANRHVLQLLVKILDTSLWIINKFFLHPIITRLGDKNIKTIIFYLRWRNFNGLIEEVSDIAPNLYFNILAYNGGW